MRTLLAIALLLPSVVATGAEWSGQIALEARHFPQDPADVRQRGGGFSYSAQPEYFIEWDDGKQSLGFVPFLRWGDKDEERNSIDIRELTWSYYAYDWELRAGIRKLFWGVTESLHLVDIINQTDFTESFDGEEKLGQPMINLALMRDWGALDLFVLPGFRERTFPGEEGRLRTQPRVDNDLVSYESVDGDNYIDLAIRWSHTLDDWDIGLYHFRGTSREPTLTPAINRAGEFVLAPHYELIHQTGLDAQYVNDGWLWKLEAIRRSGQGDHYWAAAAGFEYTFVGIAETDMDLGLIVEALYDDRGAQATTPFEEDLMIGGRLTFNDVQSTELLAGIVHDLDSSERFWSVEASRRLGDQWKLSLEARWFERTQPGTLFGSFAEDDYVQLELAWYF